VRIIHQLTKRDCDRFMNRECVHFVQEITNPRSTRAPFSGLSETMRDNEMNLRAQIKCRKNSVFRGFKRCVMVLQCGAEERT
jgi:hypothetical protein